MQHLSGPALSCSLSAGTAGSAAAAVLQFVQFCEVLCSFVQLCSSAVLSYFVQLCSRIVVCNFVQLCSDVNFYTVVCSVVHQYSCVQLINFVK